MSDQTAVVPLSETIIRHGLQAASYDTAEAVRMQDVYEQLTNTVRDALGVGQSDSVTGLSKLREEFRTADRVFATEAASRIMNVLFDALDSETDGLEEEGRAHVLDALYLHLKSTTVPYLRDEVADHLRGTSSTPEIDGAYNAEEITRAYHDAVNIKALLDQITNSFTIKELRETGFRVKETEKGRRRWDFPTLPNPTAEKTENGKRERAANRLPVFTVNGNEQPHGRNFGDIAKMVRTEDSKVGARDIQDAVEREHGKNWRDSEWTVEINGFTIHGTEYRNQ